MQGKRQKKRNFFGNNSFSRKNRRGLSAVVTTLLIILLSLVAVGGIWVVVNNFIQIGSEQIELGKFTLDLQIKSVKIQGDSDVDVTVVVRRTGKGVLIGMNFIFSDGQNSEVIRRDTTLEELDVETFVFTLDEISTSNLLDVSVAPIYELSSGKEEPGNVADMFDIKKGVGITGGVVEEIGGFEALGFEGVEMVEYSISSQSGDIVKIQRAIVDPLDVLPGDDQTFTAFVYSPNGVVSVTSITELDNSVLDLDFEKTSGFEVDGEIVETWTVTWLVNDVHTETYRTTIVATDAEGNSDSVTLTWTDSCHSQISFSDHGGDKTISSTCSTGANLIFGLDGGNIIIGTGVNIQLESGARLIFNNGKSITITASGASISSASTGSFGNGDLYYADADADSYADSETLALSGALRAKDSKNAAGVSDCEFGGSGGFIFQRVSDLGFSTMGRDNDHDGYTVASLGSFGCVGAGPTSINGRNYYKSLTNTNDWMDWSLNLGNDANDNDDTCYQNRYVDADGDGIGAGSLVCVASQGGYANTGTDCNDGDNSVWTTAHTTASDNDQDGYTDTSSAANCVGNAATVSGRTYYRDVNDLYTWLTDSQKLGTGDCYDGIPGYDGALVHPGVTAWFSSPINIEPARIGSVNAWDYNCAGGSQKLYTVTLALCLECEDFGFDCEENFPGRVGWLGGSSAACGASANYVSYIGDACEGRMADNCLDEWPISCISGSRTQLCH